MSNVSANTNNTTSKGTDNVANTNSEPSFSIQPHPAKTNDPADLQSSRGLRGAMDAFDTPGPFVPNEEMLENFPQPLSHEELQAKQAALKE